MTGVLLKNLRQIVSPMDHGSSNSGAEQSKLSVLTDSSILIEKNKIREIGDISRNADKTIDCQDMIALPGFIDSHTHIVYSGSRYEEFYQKIEGRTYLEILQSGNGIGRTVRETEAASYEKILQETAARVKDASSHGTTTIEMKTGYSSSVDGESKMLSVMESINSANTVRVVKTLLPLHSVSMGKTAGEHVDFVIKKEIPLLLKRADFVDSFCDAGAFSPDDTAKLFSAVTPKPLRLHSDEINNIGCLNLTDQFKISSADHLLKIDSDGYNKLAKNKVTANLLPITAFALNEKYPSARRFIDAGIAVSISSDSSPLTRNQNMQFAIYLAIRFCGLTIEEAINSATINAAHSLGIGNLTGTIEVGKEADLVLMKLSDYKEIPYEYATNPVAMTVRGGAIIR